MRFLSVFRKSLREQGRDLLGLSLTLAFAPIFVLLYWLFFPSGSTTYEVLVLNMDVGVQLSDGTTMACGKQVVEAMEAVTYADGSPLLLVEQVEDRAAAEDRLKDRDAEVLLVIPDGFSQSIQAARQGHTAEVKPVIFVGDLTNPYYAVAAVMAGSALDAYVQAATGQPRPIAVSEEPLGASAARTEFEIYVPGIMVFSVMMLVFQAAMSVTREVETGKLRRLQITRMTAFDFLGGTSAVLVLVGVTAVVLAVLTAWVLGFRSQGPLWAALIIGAVTSLSVIGSGLIVACFSKTVSQAFVIANFPLALFMFFTGAVFPIPSVPLFTLAGHAVSLYDLLPPTHAVVALNKILTLGAGIGEVLYELSALVVLSLAYYAIGVCLFQRTHMRPE